MSFYQLFCILRARRRLAGLILLSTLALALLWIALRPVRYTAIAPVLLDMRSDPVSGSANALSMLSPGFLATQFDIVRSERVARRVVQTLKLDQQPDEVRRWRDATQGKTPVQPWLAQQLQKRLDVRPSRESNIISIAWTGRTPAEAAQVANAFAQAYLDISLELKTDPARGYAAWFDDQVKSARQNLQAAQTRLSDYQQEAGILGADERSDYETARLNALSAQLTTMLGRRGSAGDDPETTQGAVANGLRTDVARLEAKVQESGAALGANHPQMQRMQAELASLRAMLAREAERVRSSISGNGRELENAVAAQKARVLALAKKRGQLNLLQHDVDAAQKAFDAVSTSASQVRLQSLTNQANVLWLAPASEPLDAAGIAGGKAMVIAAVAGALLALAGALLAELINRRVRSAQDLVMTTRLPLLASVPVIANAYAATLAARPAAPSRRLGLASHGGMG